MARALALAGVAAFTVACGGRVEDDSRDLRDGDDRPSGAMTPRELDPAGGGRSGADAPGDASGSSSGGTFPAGAGAASGAPLGTGGVGSEGGSAGTRVGSDPSPIVTGDPAQPPEPPPDVEVWVGQVNRHVTYPETLDALATAPQTIALRLERSESGALTGTIAFGDVPLAPPTDGSAPYPGPYEDERINWLNWLFEPIAGFSYTLVDPYEQGGVLRLAFVGAELWKAWCEMQQSTVPVDSPWATYSCLVAGDGIGAPAPGLHPTREELCMTESWSREPPACLCDESGCTSYTGIYHMMDLVVQGDVMVGAFMNAPLVQLVRTE